MRPRTLAIAGCAAVLALARLAAAHPLDLGYLRVTADGAAISVALDLHVDAAARLAGIDPAALDAGTAAGHAAALADATLRRAPIATGAGTCRWTAVSATVAGRTASLAAEAACPATSARLSWALPWVGDARASPTLQILVKARIAGGDRVAIVDRLRPSIALAASPASGFGAFVWTGIEHIGAAPDPWRDATGWKLPDGLDHLLFLVALLLAGGSLIHILGIVSGFTLGHSITLALSALDLVRPPAALIEPLIALSIALVAGEALLDVWARSRAAARARPGGPGEGLERRRGHRWKLASAFGLIHGFGFAGALNELELSTGDLVSALLGYNLGVELGQVAIVVVAAPWILGARRHRRLHPVIGALAAAIVVAGMTWFVERLG